MSPDPYIIPDTIVSLAAILGLLIVIRRIDTSGTGRSLALAFKAALIVTAFFLVVRLLYWHIPFGLFRLATYASASLLPLMALLVAETLLRRHAPRWAKIFVLAGTVALSVGALWPSFTSNPAYTLLLLGFQLCGFLIVAGMVIGRDTASLSEAENLSVFRVGLSLLFIVPFVISDHRFDAAPIPVRLSGLAILVLCWLSLGLSRPAMSSRLYVRIFVLYLATVFLATVFLSWQMAFGWAEVVQLAAIMLALLLVAAIVRDDLQIGEERTQGAVIAGIGGADTPSLDAYLGALEQQGVLANALMIKADMLAEFDQVALAGRLRGVEALAAADLPPDPQRDSLADSQLRALFERYGATHLFEVSREPLQLAAVRQPGFAARQADRDLSAAFGLARLIAERDRLQAKLQQYEGGTA